MIMNGVSLHITTTNLMAKEYIISLLTKFQSDPQPTGTRSLLAYGSSVQEEATVWALVVWIASGEIKSNGSKMSLK